MIIFTQKTVKKRQTEGSFKNSIVFWKPICENNTVTYVVLIAHRNLADETKFWSAIRIEPSNSPPSSSSQLQNPPDHREVDPSPQSSRIERNRLFPNHLLSIHQHSNRFPVHITDTQLYMLRLRQIGGDGCARGDGNGVVFYGWKRGGVNFGCSIHFASSVFREVLPKGLRQLQ